MAGRGRGRGRGKAPPRVPVSLVGRTRSTPATAPAGPQPATHGVADHVTTVGVKRASFGHSGTAIQVYTNHYEVTVPKSIIHHYDVMSPSEQTLPTKATMQIMHQLQTEVAPDVFTPRAAYDARKNLFSIRRLPFTEDTHTFEVTLETQAPGRKSPKIYKVTLKHVAEINPELLTRFLDGQQSHDNAVLTAITALNVVIRMQPSLSYPFNVRSFFTDRETSDLGHGLILWRGYFQSIRPGIRKMLVNIDISTAAMFKPGPMITLAGEFLSGERGLASALLHARERLRLQRFFYGVRVVTRLPSGELSKTPRVLKRISEASARDHRFTLREGGTMTVMEYFEKTYNRVLQYPDLPCVEVGNGALIPMELCHIVPGQFMRKQIPASKVNAVVSFSTKRPESRLNSIKAGLGVLAYGQSEYVREFGLHVRQDQPDQKPILVNARILATPVLQYGGPKGKPDQDYTVKPAKGSWSMLNKKFIKPAVIETWCIAIFERAPKFSEQTLKNVIKDLVEACRAVGIVVQDPQPVCRWLNAQGTIVQSLEALYRESVNKRTGKPPNLVVVILPENATDLYTSVKHFGDIKQGVATQCLKAIKCLRANAQYYANVCLKINVKLGGINTVPAARQQSFAILTDPSTPTIVMGADVIHPAAHSTGRPSFAALVASLDKDTAKYIADCRVQTSRQEMIEDLEPMAKHMLATYMGYRRKVENLSVQQCPPKRLIFYRDGVSEGQFKQVLEIELPRIQGACAALGIKPAITVIVVGKRHHVRFFPTSPSDKNQDTKSGNCMAGTVVDNEITHPLELDFYLQSHAGLLGTSRPAHYNVLYDENRFSPDALQNLSFALCHVYARSTRSVSIPAPVYYADIVCSRAKNHYDPDSQLKLDDAEEQPGSNSSAQLESFKEGFKGLHANIRNFMYFS